MIIRFDTKIKRNLGILFKEGENPTSGLVANINLALENISRLEVRYRVNDQSLVDVASIIDVKNNLIRIPFKVATYPVGRHEFELVATLSTGEVKISQCLIYRVITPLEDDNTVDLAPLTYVDNLVTDINNTLDSIQEHIDDLELVKLDDIKSKLNVVNSMYNALEDRARILEDYMFHTELLTLINRVALLETDLATQSSHNHEVHLEHGEALKSLQDSTETLLVSYSVLLDRVDSLDTENQAMQEYISALEDRVLTLEDAIALLDERVTVLEPVPEPEEPTEPEEPVEPTEE